MTTLRQLLAKIESRDGKEGLEAELDKPLIILVHDAHRNISFAQVRDDYPHKTEDCVRFECFLSDKRMVDAKKKAA